MLLAGIVTGSNTVAAGKILISPIHRYSADHPTALLPITSFSRAEQPNRS